jgi:tagatose 1,6-diphosphate aldolase
MSKELFTALTPGKLMGLRQITDEKGRFKVLAMDQSNSFKKALRAMHEKAGAPAEPSYEEVRDCKVEMTAELAQHASALLLDVNFGLRQALNAMAFPKNVGLIARVEASKNAGSPGEYEPGWGVEKIKRMGASAVKLLVFLDTEDKESTKSQIEFVKKVSKACREQDILLMTEELSYPRDGETKQSESYVKRLFKNIFEATKLIGPHTDVLKLEFPGTVGVDSDAQIEDNLGKLDAAAIRPWVILSAGVDFDVFEGQVEKALKAGCNGYMAGRAIFKEYFEGTDDKTHQIFLKSAATDRMKTLNAMVDKHAKSWMERYGISPKDMAAAVSETWYLDKDQAPVRQAETTGAY